ncbi:MAG: D-2-hydroxyacid dehydrogenase [Saprospiraceae bacterium]|nr:D-2-hydroxyacid dehydrogenase [Saprospiraceae bacterium]
MIKILVNDGIEADGKMLLEEAEYIVDTNRVAQEDLPKVLPQYDVVIVRSATQIRKDLIDVCPNLKVIARGGVGMDNIDVDYARNKGIAVINTPGASTRSVAELAMAHIYALSRHIHHSKLELLNGKNDFKKLKSAYSKGSELAGKTLGIIGFGRIGQEVAKLAMGANMRILPYDPFVEETTLNFNIFGNDNLTLALKIKTIDKDYLIRNSDFITLHLPFSDGKPIIGAEEISRMKEGVILINSARGGAIDEDALLEGLLGGKIYGAGLDVFENEPNPRKELLEHPMVSVTPHIGGSTQEAQAKIGIELADRIITYLESSL